MASHADAPQDVCEKCGHKAYGLLNIRGKNVPRCFPHFNGGPRGRGARFMSQQLKSEMRYKLEHIDVGFPYVSGGPWEDRMNATREDAWGHAQLLPSAAQRAGLTR
jgi:hypothetical protein